MGHYDSSYEFDEEEKRNKDKQYRLEVLKLVRKARKLTEAKPHLFVERHPWNLEDMELWLEAQTKDE